MIQPEWINAVRTKLAGTGMSIIRAKVEDQYINKINHVVVVGGGADEFFDEVRRQFAVLDQDGTVTKAESPVFANVRGFLTIGLVHARKLLEGLERGAKQLERNAA